MYNPGLWSVLFLRYKGPYVPMLTVVSNSTKLVIFMIMGTDIFRWQLYKDGARQGFR